MVTLPPYSFETTFKFWPFLTNYTFKAAQINIRTWTMGSLIVTKTHRATLSPVERCFCFFSASLSWLFWCYEPQFDCWGSVHRSFQPCFLHQLVNTALLTNHRQRDQLTSRCWAQRLKWRWWWPKLSQKESEYGAYATPNKLKWRSVFAGCVNG